jgi:hypothetical protein
MAGEGRKVMQFLDGGGRYWRVLVTYTAGPKHPAIESLAAALARAVVRDCGSIRLDCTLYGQGRLQLFSRHEHCVVKIW